MRPGLRLVLALGAGLLALPAPAFASRAKDSDRDGLRDRYEVRHSKTNPHRRDTDRDGLSDGFEVRRSKTNPRRRDTDRDGLSDGYEVRRSKTNPRDPNSPRPRRLTPAPPRLTPNPLPAPLPDPGPLSGPGTPPALPALPLLPCTTVVTSIAAAQSAVGAAAPESVVCLADGTYGRLVLSPAKPAPGVTVRAQNPGASTLAGATLSGSNLTLARFKLTANVSVSATANGVTVDHNDITGGVNVIGSSSSYATAVTLTGNLIRPPGGSGEKDSLMLQRFRGLRIENNQIWIADEDGMHNDGLQTVWGGKGLVFRGNWMRGGAGSQGFFIKDGEVTNVTFEDNLIAGRPSKAPYGGAPFQVFGVVANAADPFYTGYGMVMRNNTIWSNPNTSYMRECGNRAFLVERNVLDGWNAPDGRACVTSQLTQFDNVIAGGSIGRLGSDVAGPPQFTSTATNDWRLMSSSPGTFASGRAGVTWSAAARPFGP